MSHPVTRRRALALAALGGLSAVTAKASAFAAAEPGIASGTGEATLAAFGGKVNDPKFDNTPALNAALSPRSKITRLIIPPGQWTFLTRPRPISRSITIQGIGASTSQLVRRYSEVDEQSGLLTVFRGNFQTRDFGVLAAPDTHGGAGIALLSRGRYSPDYSALANMQISGLGGTGTWNTALLFDGSARDPGAPKGLRDISLFAVNLFASEFAALHIKSCVSVSAIAGGYFSAGGKTGRIFVTGTDACPSYYIFVQAPYIDGVYLEHCRYARIKASVFPHAIKTADSAECSTITGFHSDGVEIRGKQVSYTDPGSGKIIRSTGPT